MFQLLRKNLIFLAILILAFSWADFVFSSQQGVVESTVEISICGDEIAEGPEECDPPGAVSDFRGKSCQDFGHTQGNLYCDLDCTIDASGCYTPPAPPPVGGISVPSPIETKVIIKGQAYPNSEIHILKDGKEITTTKADSKADFKKEISEITPGIYTFALWAEDKDGIKSITYTLTFRVISNVITTVSGIFLPSTIDIDNTSIPKGEILNIFGQTVPEVKVDVHVLSSEIVTTVSSDEIGAWLLPFNTEPLDEGAHITKARFQFNAKERSGFGKVLTFYVGEKAVSFEEIDSRVDFNGDDRINLVDFSILLSWWKKPNPQCDLNKNGIVDLADFSILLSRWTG